MCADKTDVDNPISISNINNYPVFVPFYIENYPAIADYARIPVNRLDVIGFQPFCTLYISKPGFQA
jgi:hypothetical protein